MTTLDGANAGNRDGLPTTGRRTQSLAAHPLTTRSSGARRPLMAR